MLIVLPFIQPSQRFMIVKYIYIKIVWCRWRNGGNNCLRLFSSAWFTWKEWLKKKCLIDHPLQPPLIRGTSPWNLLAASKVQMLSSLILSELCSQWPWPIQNQTYKLWGPSLGGISVLSVLLVGIHLNASLCMQSLRVFRTEGYLAGVVRPGGAVALPHRRPGTGDDADATPGWRPRDVFWAGHPW